MERAAAQFIAGIFLMVQTTTAAELWDFPTDFRFGAARDGQLE